MIEKPVRRLAARLADWWNLGDPAERIEGTGEVYLDPAYNGRYTAERRLEELSQAQDEAAPEEAAAELPDDLGQGPPF